MQMYFYGHQLLSVLLGKYFGVESLLHFVALSALHNFVVCSLYEIVTQQVCCIISLIQLRMHSNLSLDLFFDP